MNGRYRLSPLRTALCAALTSVALTSCAPQTPQIIGGRPTSPSKLAAVVGLTYNNERQPKCTASLIAPTMVLTAAHCICRVRPTHVFVGDDANALSGPTSGLYYHVVDVRSGLVCGQETSRSGVDVAVVEIANEVKNVHPLRFAPAPLIDEARGFRIVGFGAVDPDGRVFTHRKMEAAIGVMSHSCSVADSEQYGCQVGQEIVAGRPLTTDTCVGDSGGPLLVAPDATAGRPSSSTLFLAGVTSRSVDDAETVCGGGGIYERLRPQVVTWVLRAMESMAAS